MSTDPSGSHAPRFLHAPRRSRTEPVHRNDAAADTLVSGTHVPRRCGGENQVTADRSGNAPRRGRGGRRGGRPQQQQGQGPRANQHPQGPRPPRRGGGPPHGPRDDAGNMAGGPHRAADGRGFQPRVPRPATPRPASGNMTRRRENGASGWTTVRPWRPPRDDASEPILDDDTQPDWTEHRPARPTGLPTAGVTRGRLRPPAWPGGSGGRRATPRPGTGPNRREGAGNPPPRGQRPGGHPNQRPNPPNQRNGADRRPRAWMPNPGPARDDDE